LNRAGVRPVLVGEEVCCGHDLLWSGERETFESLAKANAAAFETRGVRHIVTACAECARTWRADYPDVVPDYRPRVEHVAEFAARQLGDGAISFEDRDGQAVGVTYHDPCRLGRHLGVLDEPRTVLDALPGAQRSEMKHSREDAMCCGTSGFQHCDRDSKRIQAERLAEASQTGASTLVTACPKCMIHLACAQTEDRRLRGVEPEVELRDFTVLVASHLDAPGSDATRAESREETNERFEPPRRAETTERTETPLRAEATGRTGTPVRAESLPNPKRPRGPETGVG
jgi:Fe-S oxidoreductase